MAEASRTHCGSLAALMVLAFGGAAAVAISGVLAPQQALASDSLEERLRNADQDKAYADLLDLLDAALGQPVDLAIASRAEIAGLPWISPWLADSIVAARSRGDLASLDDLRKIGGISERQLDALRPFVVITGPRKTAVPVKSSLRLRVVASPPSSSFSKIKTFGTYSLETAGLRLGMVVEKDKAEKTLNDFQACYLERTWANARLIVGNFVLASGHGLVFSDAFGESPGAVDPWRFGRGQFGLKPFTSSEENCMFEGVGLAGKWHNLEVCLAGSRSRFDAHIDDQGRATSLGTSGLHVSQSEIAGKDQLAEVLVAAATRYSLGGAQVTVNLGVASLSRDLVTERFTWRKDRARFAGSTDFSLEHRGSLVFGEAALGQGGGPAMLGGLASGNTNARVLVLGRKYSRSYVSLHSRPFAFYSGTATGEQGLLTYIVWRPSRRASISLSNDIHRRDSTSDDDLGTSGSETFADASVAAGDFTFTLGEKLSRASESGATGTEETTRLRSRLDVEYQPARAVEIRARYENLGSRVAQGGTTARSTSDLLRLDVGLACCRAASVKAGCYTFTVEDYAARIYQYEAGVPYYPSLEMLKGDGSRCYAVLSLGTDITGRAAVKVGRTVYEGGDEGTDLAASYMVRF